MASQNMTNPPENTRVEDGKLLFLSPKLMANFANYGCFLGLTHLTWQKIAAQ